MGTSPSTNTCLLSGPRRALALLACLLPAALAARPASRTPLLRAVELESGEALEVELGDGSRALVKLLRVREARDPIRNAVRRAEVDLEVNGTPVTLAAGNYHLPRTVAGVRIDCPVTRGYTTNTRWQAWALEKEARLRLWPAGSPLLAPGTFTYPVRDRWFASLTQMANEPTYVHAGEVPGSERIYYHYGLDIGGAEGMVDVVAATAGVVVSAGTSVLPGHEGAPVNPRYDVVYLLDDRGWYYRYSHLGRIEDGIRPGARVERAQKIGVLGKEGGSGGWSHLHFDISALEPSGKWGIQEGYAFLWEAYLREHRPELIAVARPHQVARTGDEVTLDATRSWSAAGGPLRCEWTFADGTSVQGPVLQRTYDRPGEYSEILKVTDAAGRVDYDFAVVQVFDRRDPQPLETIHAAYAPTFGIRPGDPVTFKVRSFGGAGGEVWDFGDGSPPVRVASDGNARVHAPDGYAVTVHRFPRPGDYLVRAEHAGKHGWKAVAHLHVKVEKAPAATSDPAAVYPTRTWSRKAPEEVGLDPAKLKAFSDFAGGRGCVVRHGYLVHAWGDVSRRADVASACKPFYSHFLLKALEDGRIASLDEKVVRWEPRLGELNAALGHKDREITWRQLANQTACYGLAERPGTAFAYNDWQMALFFDTLFGKVYGAAWEEVDGKVLRPLLADLLQCEDEPTFMAFGPGDRPGRVAVSARDFARFGLLYLRQGRWRGRQLLSAEHARMAVTSPLSSSIPRAGREEAEMLAGQRSIGSRARPDNQTDHFGSYSWLWWVNGVDRDGTRMWPDAPLDGFGAFGHGGPRALWVLPSLDIVVSVNDARLEGWTSGAGSPTNQAMKLLAAACRDTGRR